MNYPQQQERVYPASQQTAGKAQANAQITAFAQQLNIPPSGITILGGKPYINKIGLLSKAHQIGLKEIRLEQIKDAWETDDMQSAYKATITMKDGSIFEDEGWASLQSVKMSTLHNPDYINMTAITRAKNRALGNATGCGFVSAEELETGDIIDIEGETSTTNTFTETQEESGTLSTAFKAEEVQEQPTPPKPAESKETNIQQAKMKGVTKQAFDAYKSRCFEYVDEDILKKLASNMKLDGKKRSELTQKDLDDLLAAAMHFAKLKKQTEEEEIKPFPIATDEEEQDDVEQTDFDESEE